MLGRNVLRRLLAEIVSAVGVEGIAVIDAYRTATIALLIIFIVA